MFLGIVVPELPSYLLIGHNGFIEKKIGVDAGKKSAFL